ncbi:MAG: hypothetical protein JNK61_04620 [Bacteroidia bacterium]|nr:hypothetical protein [Bacteroidia bacterium]
MRFIILLVIICITSFNTHAQVADCDSNAYAVFRKYKGNLVPITCDTMYLLNKFTFKLMHETYNMYRQQNLLLGQYQLVNDSIASLYELQLDTQRMYFDTLNAYFQKLANTADTLVSNSKNQLGSITKNLNVIEKQVNAAKTNISDASNNIIEAKKQMRKQRLKWAVGGFAIGAGATFLATLIL